MLHPGRRLPVVVRLPRGAGVLAVPCSGATSVADGLHDPAAAPADVGWSGRIQVDDTGSRAEEARERDGLAWRDTSRCDRTDAE